MSITTESEPAAPTTAPNLLPESIREKLAASPFPLKLTDVVKGLARPKKVTANAFQGDALRALETDCHLGRAFRYPSGLKGVERFWVRDEKQLLRDAVVREAVSPKTLAAIRTALGKVLRGTDPTFVDGVIRELIGEDRLFEYPPKTKAGGPLFGSVAPPPPLPTLEQPKFRKKLDAIARSAAKLLADAGSTVDDLTAALRRILSPEAVAQPPRGGEESPTVSAELDRLILEALSDAGPGSVVALPDLRRRLPPKFRGRVFDEAVLGMAGEGRLRVYQDADPMQFTPEERAACVSDRNGHLFTSVAKRE